MPSKKSTEAHDKQVEVAAFLYGHYDMSQEEIAAHLNCSQSHVSRLLSNAKLRGLLKTEHYFVEKRLSEERLAELHKSLEPYDLMKKLGDIHPRNRVRVRNITVIDSMHGLQSSNDWSERQKIFGRAAAGHIYRLLRHSKIAGVAWGTTLGHLVEGFASIHPQFMENPIDFVPVCAELAGSSSMEISSSRLADRLNEIINNRKGKHLSLSGVPAFVPRLYTDNEERTIWKYINNSESYTKIFGGEEPLVDSIDTLITCVGSAQKPLGLSNEELRQAGDIKQDLEELIYGDIGGVLIQRSNLNSKNLKEVNELNNMWTGIHLDKIKRIAEIASVSKKTPGNIVLAIGENKTNIIYGLLKQGLINELYIDKDLKVALEKVLET